METSPLQSPSDIPVHSLNAAVLGQILRLESVPGLAISRCSSSRGPWRQHLPSLARGPTPPGRIRNRLRELPEGSVSDPVSHGLPSSAWHKQTAVSAEAFLRGPPGSGARRVRRSPWLRQGFLASG